ncbi:hypothetical protein PCASD_16414 [Puccinia coronata f. sp. avenae]|uniref:TRAPP trafficking subunit Trs65-domain-containing protein n=1 Tax=Puccinia coronata f. sp. avenae TaxID=200324 RepID=A0A2N5TCQ3_9BASI|nr:hypothetical protein PCASD_16414 [Puccinia coronata f. sp. avenae]
MADQLPSDWPTAFQSAHIRYILSADQMPRSDTDSLAHEELASWLDKLIKTPARQSVYLGEALNIHIILSLTEPAAVESVEYHHIQNHLQESLSVNIQADLLPSSAARMPSIQSDGYLIDPPSPEEITPKPLASNRSQQPSILLSPSHGVKPQEFFRPFQSTPLFTASFSQSKADSPNKLPQINPSDTQKLVSFNAGNHVSLRVAKLANRWLVAWNVDCEIGSLGNSTLAGSLSLSTVITYHSSQSPLFDPPRPSILPAALLSDSPPNFNPPPSSEQARDYGFENAIEIDLFDGMGRDISVSLTRPLITPGSSNSAYQVESTHKSQSKRQPSPSNRYPHSQINPKILSGVVNPSRSDDYLPTIPDQRSQSEPAPSVPIVRRAFSSAYRKESSPIRPTHPEIEPRAPDFPFLKKNLTSVIPIVDPLIIRVHTIAPQHQLKPRELTADQTNHPEIWLVEMEKLFNPMLMLELCYQGDATGASEEDFLVESLDIKLEEQGLLPEFDNFVASTIKIKPIHPTQPSGDNLPYRISRSEAHNLIYVVQIEPANVLPEQGQQHDSSFLQYGCPPVNISLPPSTLISSVRSAFTHQKAGIPIVKDPEHENVSSSAAAGRADHAQGGGAVSGKPYRTMRPLRSSYEPVLEDLSESAGRLSIESVLQKPAGVVYLLSVTIRGKFVSKDSRIGSTGLISASWTSLLTSHELSHSATLDLRRQMDGGNTGDAAAPWSVDDLAEKVTVTDLILPGGYENEQHLKRFALPHGGLVAGSKRHTASNLINALQELSNFQRGSSTGGLPLSSERSRAQAKQLSPLAFGHDSGFAQQKTPHDLPSLPGSPTSTTSPSLINLGRGFTPNTRLRTPTAAASHSSPQVPERAHQPSENEPKMGNKYSGRSKPTTPCGPSREAKLVTPGLIGAPFTEQMQATQGAAFEGGRSRGTGEMLVKVNVASPTGGDGTNRFKVLTEFFVEIVVFNRSSSSALPQGPFQVKILTNDHLLRELDQSLHSPKVARPRHPSACARGHDVGGDDAAGGGGGVVSLDENIQIGPLGDGECQAIKIRLIGLKPGIFQLHGVHFLSLSNAPPPPPPFSLHHHHQQQQPLSQFILLDPLVVLIE